MGCFKSKHKYGVSNAKATEQMDRSKSQDPALGESHLKENALLPDAALLDYAQRLSEDIVATAVSQLIEIENRYRDIPYIESDVW
uniref:Small membrane A-kinase anchor protein n=1 Tax=Callorhinchus milii TaxID=7868 RepID=A0A4W3IZ58_CALMI|eukprot:gi/632946003/ref/XP_007888341.1/ PREDICTED: small membrane A-kinase anchor protein [Callorhinchus milii]